jgi:hypothetical protein
VPVGRRGELTELKPIHRNSMHVLSLEIVPKKPIFSRFTRKDVNDRDSQNPNAPKFIFFLIVLVCLQKNNGKWQQHASDVL